MIKKILIVLLAALCIAFSGAYFIVQEEINAPRTLEGQERVVEIKQGSGLLSIASQLENEGLIKNKYVFALYAASQGKHSELKAGTYTLTPSMTPRAIAQKLWQGESTQVTITIPEGFSLEQIEQRLNQAFDATHPIGNIKTEEYKDKFSFLEQAPDETSLEGFLFPDTYFFQPNVSSEEIVNRMLSNFKAKALPHIEENKENISEEKNIFQFIIMASLLEKEVIGAEDKKVAADILWRRIEIGMPLQVDATIVYITGKKTTDVSIKETEIESPYNTYKYRGLPVGPICNPGLESIDAALNPKESGYWYYLTTGEGETIFSTTLAEHNYNKSKYLIR